MRRLYEWDEFETEDEQDDPPVDELKDMFAFLSPDQLKLLKDLHLEMEQYEMLWDILEGHGESKYEEGVNSGYADGYDEGYNEGHGEGYDEGYDEAKDEYGRN